MSKATIKILEEPKDRYVNTKSGQRQVWAQKAQLETDTMRIMIDYEIDGPNDKLPVGAVKEWDVIADLVPGRFGPELARRMTLIDPARSAPAPATAKA